MIRKRWIAKKNILARKRKRQKDEIGISVTENDNRKRM